MSRYDSQSTSHNRPDLHNRTVTVSVQFTETVTGPRGLAATCSAEDIFDKLLTSTFVSLAVVNTNLYAQQTNRSNWVDTWDTEMRAFIGVILFLGAKKTDRCEAWLPYPFGEEFIKAVFFERRFIDLLACFHLVDNESVSDADKKADSFWQVAPLINTLNKTFPQYYTPKQDLSADEITTPFKGRHRAKQFNKDKPNKWGFKSFALAESCSGYILQFFPYQGRDQKRTPGESVRGYTTDILQNA